MENNICHGIRVPCVIELVLQGSDTILYAMHTQNRPGIHHGCEGIRGVEGNLLLVLCRYYQYFPYQFLYVHICTPYLGGVRSEADVANFVTQTRSEYLKESCKDIDTVRNMNIVARSNLLGY